MPNFPKTNIAYQMAIEYCSIQMIELYQQAYFAIQDGRKPNRNTNDIYDAALSSFHSMAEEFREIMKGDKKYLKTEIIHKLKRVVEDDRLNNFRIASVSIIEDFNHGFPIKLIQTGEVLTDYFKDGFIVSHDFIETANYLLSQVDEDTMPDEYQKVIILPSTYATQPVIKIKTKFTVGQLAYLFRLLYDNDLMIADSLADLGRLIGTHFYNNRTDEIDIKNVTNLLSTPQKKDADAIADYFKNLRIKAINFEVKPQK